MERVKGLAARVDEAHREHAGKPHPMSITYRGRKYRLGGRLKRNQRK